MRWLSGAQQLLGFRPFDVFSVVHRIHGCQKLVHEFDAFFFATDLLEFLLQAFCNETGCDVREIGLVNLGNLGFKRGRIQCEPQVPGDQVFTQAYQKRGHELTTHRCYLILHATATARRLPTARTSFRHWFSTPSGRCYYGRGISRPPWRAS